MQSGFTASEIVKQYKKEDKIKYLNYLTGIANRYAKENQDCPVLRIIVIYTGDIRRGQTSDRYDIGAVRVKLEQAFLSELDSHEIFRHLKEKVERNELLDDEEMMELIIQPLSYRKREEKEAQIRETVKLAAQIQDRGQQLFALSGILVFADKVIDMETANIIRRAIEMTQVARIFEEEKRQALSQAEKKHKEEKERNARQIVIRMIKKNYPTEEIVSLVSSFSQDDIEALRKEVERAEL